MKVLTKHYRPETGYIVGMGLKVAAIGVVVPCVAVTRKMTRKWITAREPPDQIGPTITVATTGVAAAPKVATRKTPTK